MKKTAIFFAAMALAVGTHVQAQFDETNNLFYHTQRTPQSTLYNPAFFPTNNTFYITFPGVDFQFGSPIQMNDVIYYNKGLGYTIINLDTILHSLNETNDFRLGVNVNILGFGFKVKNTFFNFNTRLVNNLRFGLPVSTINSLLEGNISDQNEVRSVVEILNGDILNATSYVEAGIGVSHYFEPIHLTVGLRAKLLYGIANVQTDNTKVVLNTDPSLDSVSARVYYEIQSSTFAPYDTNEKEFIFNMGDILNIGKASTGVAIDLGAKYDLGPFSFSLALNDLSAGIHWKSNVTQWVPEGGQGVIEFNGLDVTTMLDNGTFSTDSLSNYLQGQIEKMKPMRVDTGDYWFSIPTKINLGASYSFAKILRAGILLHGQFDRGLLCKKPENTDNITNTFRFNTTLSLGANLFNWAELIVGSSIVYDGNSMDIFNPGVGLILTPFTVLQAYVMADYVSSFYLVESKAFNVKLGLNLLIGKGGRKKIVTTEENVEM